MKFVYLMAMSFALIDGCGKSPAAISNSPLAAPTPQKERKIVMEKEELAGLLESSHPDIAAIVRDPASKIEPFGPTLPLGAVYRVSKFAPTRMIIHYVGVVSQGDAIVLTGDADAFARFASKSGVSLTRSEDKLEYGRAYLTIANGSKRLQILNSIDDIKPRPGLNEAQTAQFQQFVAKYSSRIEAPSCIGSSCNYYVIQGQDLVLASLTIDADGTVRPDGSILESNLLIPYAM